MSKRRYCTNCVNFDIHLVVNGERMIISFPGKDVLEKQRYFDTEDKDIQKALESASGFGVYFDLSTEFDWMRDEEDAIKELSKDGEMKTFATNTEAKEWINKNYNVPYHKLSNKEQITKEYNTLGFQLQFELKK